MSYFLLSTFSVFGKSHSIIIDLLPHRSHEDNVDVLKWTIYPLHSTCTQEEQDRVFSNVPKGRRKIILATNIAESSITVTDIKYGELLP